jgi:class 3 adenylate cyclase/tetratricopeptide (TPR) repeat protein
VSSTAFEPYLPRLVREWPEAPQARARELDGTLVSLDLSGFTRLSERLQAKGRAGAEELVLLVSGVFEGLIGISDRHGGDVLKFRGDALLLLFSGEGHERRACTAASHMQWLIGATGKTMSSVGPVKLRMSCGIYTGPCHFFMVKGTHRELLVTGPAATATIRLESEAAAGQILVGKQTAAALETAWLGHKRGSGRLLRKIDDASDFAPDVEAHAASVGARQERELERYIPESLRAQLLLETGEAEHRQVTAAFVKFTGVDTLLEQESIEAVSAALDHLATTAAAAVDEAGLTWLESDIDVDGGKLYLVGGAPSSTGADEERMLRALRVIVDSDSALTLRAGVNRGPAFCGDIGALTRRTYAVMGDTVNLAARLAARAQAGQLLATGDVLDRSRTRFETESQPFLVKGKERPITAYRVGAMTGVREEKATATLPFVGRDAELAALGEAVDAVRMRRQQLVELVGPPGIGKSRLVEELKAQSVGFTQFVAGCDPYESATPYALFRNLIRPLAGITPELDAAEAGAHLAPWISTVMPDLAPWLPLLAIPFGAEVEPTPETDEIDPAFRRQRLMDTVEQFLMRVLMMPTLLVVEDAHWIDDASQELILHLTRAAAPRPWLICVTRRPQGVAFARGVDGHVQFALEPLDSNATQELALAAAGDVAFSTEALALLTDRSGGNPLFLRELVASSLGAGSVASLPESVEAVILSRIDTLAPEDRFLLRNASVLGSVFELDLLEEVLSEELSDVANLARWEQLAEFVAWDGAGTVRFLHDLFRTAAYEGLSFKRRREVHARVGRALESRGSEAALLALHFLHGQQHEASWRYAVAAGRDAQASYANVVAAENYQLALSAAAHLELDAGSIAQVAEALGDVSELAARYSESEAAYTRARKLFADDPEAQARLLWKEGVLRERLGKYLDAIRRYGKALKALEASGIVESAPTKLELELAYAGVRYRQGRFTAAVSWAERAATHADAAADRTRLAHAYYLEHIARVHSGSRDPEHRDAALGILEEVGDLVRLSNLLNNMGIEAYFEGRWDDASELYRRSGETSQRAGDVVNVARAQNNEAEILADQGRLDEAQARFEEALRVWRAAGYRVGIALATSNLGRVAARTGRFEEAEKLLLYAVAQFEELGAESLVLETRTRLTECFVLAGRHKEALVLVRPLIASETSPQQAGIERLAGYAVVQSRAGVAKARSHFDASLERARATDTPYELALTLRAIAETSGAESPEADEILARLGVVFVPAVPLP